jgi:hypothetical protein
MARSTRLLALAVLFALIGPSPMLADTVVKSPFQKANRGASESGYPNHCRAESVAEQNAEYQLTTKDMVVVQPAEGRANVGPVKIDFCDRFEQIDSECPPDEQQIARDLKSYMESRYLDPDSILLILRSACTFPDDPGFQEATGYVVQEWVNSYGQSKEEAIESLLLRANVQEWKRQKEAGCSKLRYSEEASPEERWTVLAKRAAVGCGDGDTRDMHWYIDRTDQPSSELARLFYARECLSSAGTTPDPNSKKHWYRIGVCGPDVRALDRAKIDKETEGMPAALRAKAREGFAHAKAMFADLERAVKPIADADPDYKRLLYDAPQAAWNAWVKDYNKNKKAMDATFKFEKALFGPSVKAYGLCWDWVEQGIIDFVKAGKFKTKEQFLEAMSSPVGYTLINALGACYAVTAPASVGEILLRITTGARVWRGPRSAARYAMIDALNDIKADRIRFPMEFSWLPAGPENLIVQVARQGGERSKISNGGGYREESEGVVSTVKPLKGEKVTLVITFKPESWMEDTRECWDTKRVRTINSHGDVLYYRKCKSTGKKKRTSEPRTMGFQTWASKGIKPNAFVKMLVMPNPGFASRGFPAEVYTNKGQTKLVNLYGFAL